MFKRSVFIMFTVDEIARATGGTVIGNRDAAVTGVSSDSRKVQAGELFVALKGASFDGHDYIAAAAEKGVRVFLAEADWAGRSTIPEGAACIAVPDTLRGLGDLAAFHRGRFAVPLIGVTGSNGKTTTKEMLATILERTGPGLKTSGNLNNLIGVPQMLFRLTKEDRWAVLEMGMSEPGEIDRLAELAGPSVGIITNAFPAHLESMGSVEAVARAKGELFLRLPAGGCAVYNAEDPLIARSPSPEGVKRLSFGLHGADISATEVRGCGVSGQSFILHLPGESLSVRMKAFGVHNIYNALAAAAAATTLKVAPQLIRAGLEAFVPHEKRFNLEEVDGIVLIDDSYNANPASMEAALVTLRDMKEECRAIAVLGDMLELGPTATQAHLELGRLAATCVDRLYVMGEMSALVADGAARAGLAASEIVTARSHDEILANLRQNLDKGDYVLVKGSRGMRMEIVADGVRRGFAPARVTGEVA
jgi:UDP-N-acetylmuramoyl-tripeptide--D-alanyl-D-alanine ligase